MKTLTVKEAASGLNRLVELALAGEQVRIRSQAGVVELRPAGRAIPAEPPPLTPLEALRLLQEEAKLSPGQAELYLREIREERLSSENRHSA